MHTINDPPYAGSDFPIVVDLDGTFVRCDLLHDIMISLALRHPLALVQLAWLSRGRLTKFKTCLAAEFPLEAEHLPYNEELVGWLSCEAARGRRIVLATVSPQGWAQADARHAGFFTDVISTSAETNAEGTAKLTAIWALLGEDRKFVYVGDSDVDLPIFHGAAGSVLLSPSARTVTGMGTLDFVQLGPLSASRRLRNTLRTIIRACRPHHWIKNLLILLPAVTGFGSYEWHRLIPLAGAFAAMCMVASAIYVANDLADIHLDRADPAKRRRPLSRATLSVPTAVLLLLVLLGVGFTAAALSGPASLGMVLLYVVLNVLYTFRLKDYELVDIYSLSGFYLLRVVLGSLVLNTPLSFWFVAFLGCLFAELAVLKKYVASTRVSTAGESRHNYGGQDTQLLLVIGVGFAFSTALILALYTQSSEISPLYRRPAFLAYIVPILLLQNVKLWIDASRGKVAADPVNYVVRSKWFWFAFLAAASLFLIARLGPGGHH